MQPVGNSSVCPDAPRALVFNPPPPPDRLTRAYPTALRREPPMPRRYCACVLCALAAAIAYFLIFAAPRASVAAPPELPLAGLQAARAEQPVSFINDVAPIL